MNLTHTEATQRTNAVSLSSYHLHFDFTDAKTSPTFPVTTTIRFRSSTPETFLDYLGPKVTSMSMDGEHIDGRIILSDLPVNEDIELVIKSESEYSRTGQGMHRFVDSADGETYLYSHLEPSDARRVFPCFDQPDLKAKFSVEMDVPEGWVRLSNRPLGEETELLSTYLTSFAAGPYVGVFDRWRDVDLGAWARKSMAQYVDKEILEITKQGLEFFDAAYGFPYPWGKYDSIFVPEYNLGAMENPGLVTFTEKYLFRSKATRAQRAARVNTILHEMSHMWFGDLVTPKWWDDLWLKESFAEFMGADSSVEATEYEEAWVNFAGNRKNWAYMQDQLPTTHPIKAEIPDVDAARQNFDGITYAKGAAVLKQLVHFVGREEFYAGARDYFKAHAFSSATFDDLLAALKNHTDRDLDSWAESWLKTTGPDTLSAHVDGETLRIAPTRLPHRIDVTVYDQDFSAHTYDVDVHEAVEIEIAQPSLIVLNDNDHTYAKVTFDETSLKTLKEKISELPALTRAVVWTGLWNQTRDGEVPAEFFVDTVLNHGGKETNATIATQIFANAQFAVRHYLSESDYADRVWELLRGAEPGSDMQLILARAAISAGGEENLRAMLAGEYSGLVVDTDLRWGILSRLAAHDAVDIAELDAELTLDNTLTGKAAHLGAAHAFPKAEVKAQIFEQVQVPGKYSNAELDSLLAAFNAPDSAHLRKQFVAPFFQVVEKIWSEHPIEMANRIVRGLYPETPETDALTNKVLEREIPSALRRVLLEEQDHLRRTLRVAK